MIVAGDIGGTKVALAVFEEQGFGLQPRGESVFPSQDYATFEAILEKFLREKGLSGIGAGCFAVAGPVRDGRAAITNLPWVMEEAKLAKVLGAAQVKLLNDVEAAAHGMLFLRPEDLEVLNPGEGVPHKGVVAVISAGTGLGEAVLYWDGQHHHPIASEGGHADFAPRNEREVELLRFLWKKFGGHVSCERIVSGPGLHNVYAFLRSASDAAEPDWLKQAIADGDPSAAISEAALGQRDPVCVDALEMFCEIYGAEAGNLALTCLAYGGVYIGGGIAPKILPALKSGAFMRGFTDKGRFADMMGSMRVSVALNPRTPLIGAANYAVLL